MCVDDFSFQHDMLKYNTFDARLMSFINWPGKIEPRNLARAGFYYSKEDDIVQCFWCNIHVYNFKSGDCAFSDHLKYSPRCDYARLIKNYVNDVSTEDTTKEITEPSLKKVNINTYKLFLVCLTLIIFASLCILYDFCCCFVMSLLCAFYGLVNIFSKLWKEISIRIQI